MPLKSTSAEVRLYFLKVRIPYEVHTTRAVRLLFSPLIILLSRSTRHSKDSTCKLIKRMRLRINYIFLAFVGSYHVCAAD